MASFQKELELWAKDAEDLIRTGARLSEQNQDIQRQKLVYYLLREVASQYQTIRNSAQDLLDSIHILEDMMSDSQKANTKYKHYPR